MTKSLFFRARENRIEAVGHRAWHHTHGGMDEPSGWRKNLA